VYILQLVFAFGMGVSLAFACVASSVYSRVINCIQMISGAGACCGVAHDQPV
jgi:hypothetical protein